jgi:predicted flap endonuclease-1-like 5' DNA nuclease
VIWHLFEVWLTLLAAFLAGCALGALLHDVVAGSRFAVAQGAVIASIGDVLDTIKDRLGLGPVWRPQYQRVIERPARLPRRRAPVEVEPVAKVGWHDGSGEPTAEFSQVNEADDIAPIDEHNGSALVPVAPMRAAISERETVAVPRLPVFGGIAPMRPASLAEPRNGVPDNLQRIRGIGERNEVRLNKLGIFHFGQIAAWTPAEIAWIAQQLAFPERIERDDWVGQATVLASGGETGFVKSADRRRARRQQPFDEDGGDDDATGESS